MGVIVICLPILPGIRHRRKPRPDLYTTSDTIKRRRLEASVGLGRISAVREKGLSEAEDPVSGDDSDETVIVARPDPAIVNEIRGGEYEENGCSWFHFEGDGAPDPGQIVKTTRIEQSV